MPVVPNEPMHPGSEAAQQAVKAWLQSNATKGGRATAVSERRYKFNSETARRAALHRWPKGPAAKKAAQEAGK